ncbi:hypothetical protein M0R88_16525 [Halorussus gelatinilyticus]|uniref:Uncharacterized protein n=1 Tax=Halorussus gelatinilyticus TaxID=2937524 RepID=A0A8U0IG95_9EURY|nr:hypothetical protein [Halorussus gelatinilyticus]UPW00107.1 hypothetical protein M0R88_16525 [Halorussus gelatinilyticus]
MVGGTLRDLRERIVDRHDEDGRYFVSCARTGERPVPVAGKRFATRETAARAAELAAEYRAELRRYDPRLAHYDLVVSEEPGPSGPVDPVPVVEESGGSSAADFCHDVAAAVFEALSELGEEAVERAVLEAYLHSAESVTDPDELCLVLLSTAASELDARLAPDRQGEVLRVAADRLGARSERTPRDGDDPVAATLSRFDGLSLVADYAVVRNAGDESAPSDVSTASDESAASDDDGRSWTVTVEEWAFDSVDGRVPTLPFAVELLRRLPDERIAVSDLRAAGDAGWRFVVSTAAPSARAVSLAAPEND